MNAPDLHAAASAVKTARDVVDRGFAHLATTGAVETAQVVAYDLAQATAGVEIADTLVADYGPRGDEEARISCAFAAEAVADVAAKLFGREAAWGVEAGALDGTREFVATYRDPEFLATIDGPGPRHLDGDFELVQDTFRRFAEDKIRPVAEHVHRTNSDIPEDVISGLAELGTFGLSVPEEYGGFAAGGDSDYIAMVVATEELSRGSLGVGGSLITRPEILTRALVKGGTEEQKHHWLPKLASAEAMAAVAVTEPDTGSDSAAVTTTATRTEGGWLINGVKTWCTFGARADVLMLLARTDPDRSLRHRGLSLFVVPKPPANGHGFELVQEAGDHGAPGGGKLEGRPIDTIGYRGMHSYEIALDGWFVPDDCLVGGEAGLGQGFYLQMAGFENGRLQTAARAIGVMQAAYEDARQYARDRRMFGQTLADFQLTQAKLARMAITIQGARQFSYAVARMMATGGGSMEAALVKAYVCKAAEWVTREAMQIHGGYGYAEEYAVSRYFVDARVLSIFEGADEVLCLRVIARRRPEPSGRG